MKRTTFVVSGRGVFPFDMLRYDGCFPKTSDDVAGMDLRYGDPDTRGVRHVTLVRYHNNNMHAQPTVARWSSFGWSVVQVGMLAPYTEKVV